MDVDMGVVGLAGMRSRAQGLPDRDGEGEGGKGMARDDEEEELEEAEEDDVVEGVGEEAGGI
jgi:hypothetical protein